MAAPAGGLIKLNVRVLAGRSASLAVLVITSVTPSLMVWLAIAANTGALFTSVVTTVKLLVSLKGGAPLSVTRTMITFVLGPCASVGAHVKTPVTGLMAAPAGGLSRLRVSASAEPSGSVALIITLNTVPSLTVWLGIAASTGARFTEPTTARKLCVALSGGEPLSVTRTLIVFALGWPGLGVHVNTPLLGLMLAPTGADTRLNV